MSANQSYEEALDANIRAMGPELGPVYHRLWNHSVFLHMRWAEYVRMFGNSQAEFDIMNEVAPGFFKTVQDMYWQTILLGLCRFTDNARVGARRTLSLDALLKIPAAHSVSALPVLVESARRSCRFARDWRHRAIAHADLEYELDRTDQPLAPASRLDVRVALEKIASVLDTVSFHFAGSTTYWGDVGFSWGGDHLLLQLKLINRLQDERMKRLRSGAATADDMNWNKWNGKS